MRVLSRSFCSILYLAGLGAAYAAASEEPVLVSPGLPGELVVVDGPCPTFSWVGIDGGVAQELVVYEVDGTGAAIGTPTLTMRLPARASSWTPPAAQCFARGRSYAWSLRAIGGQEPSEWGAPYFFGIPAAPTAEEFRAGLEVVQAYLAATQQDPPVELLEAREREQGPGEGEGDAAHPEGRIRKEQAGVISGFHVGPAGAVEAASFTGDGSGLTGIGAASIVAGAVGSSEIATNAVGPLEIADNAIDQGEIAANGVGESELAPDSVGPEEIQDNAVGPSQIMQAAVGSSEIANASITADDIAANAVGGSEMAGSFCLVKRGQSHDCPSGYTSYIITFDTEDDQNGDICTDGEVEWGCIGSRIFLAFCCA